MSFFIKQRNTGLTSHPSGFLISNGGHSQGCVTKHLAKIKFSAGRSPGGFVGTSVWCCVQGPTRGGTGVGLISLC